MCAYTEVSRNPPCSLLGSVLAEVNSIKTMIPRSPSLAVFFEGLLVGGEGGLPQFEFLFSIIKFWNVLLTRSLECLFGLECLLKVHPVLGGVVEWLLWGGRGGLDRRGFANTKINDRKKVGDLPKST